MAGFHLSSAQYDELTAMYPSPIVDKPVCWKAFVDEVNLVFSKPNLERNPLEEVDPAPDFLLDPARFTTRSDTVEGSEALDALLGQVGDGLPRVDAAAGELVDLLVAGLDELALALGVVPLEHGHLLEDAQVVSLIVQEREHVCAQQEIEARLTVQRGHLEQR